MADIVITLIREKPITLRLSGYQGLFYHGVDQFQKVDVLSYDLEYLHIYHDGWLRIAYQDLPRSDNGYLIYYQLDEFLFSEFVISYLVFWNAPMMDLTIAGDQQLFERSFTPYLNRSLGYLRLER